MTGNLLEKSRKKSLLSFKFLIGRAWIVCISTKYPNPIQYAAWYISNPMLTQMKRNFKNCFGHNVRLTESCKSSTKKIPHTFHPDSPDATILHSHICFFILSPHTHYIYTINIPTHVSSKQGYSHTWAQHAYQNQEIKNDPILQTLFQFPQLF